MQGRNLIRRSAGLCAAIVLATTGALVAVPTVTAGATNAADALANRPDGPAIAAERVADAHSGDAGAPDATAVENPDVNAQAVITVTTTTDGGAGSLREAIETLAVNPGGDTVVLQAGATYTLTCPAGDLDHGNTPLIIQGNGATLTMAGGCNERILENGTGALVLEDVNFSGVSISVVGPYYGGLVLTSGDLTLTRVTATGNSFTATAGPGGSDIDVFSMDGPNTTLAVLTDVVVSDTTVDTPSGGCGVFCTYVTTATRLSLDATTLVGGDCGIFCSNDVTLIDSSITNTTVDLTRDGGGDCGVFCTDDVIVRNSTISDFTVTAPDGGSCGVFCNDDVTIEGSTVSGFDASVGTYICGVFCSGDVTMTDSTVTDMAATSAATNNSGHCGTFCGSDVSITRSQVTDVSWTVQGSGGGGFCGGTFCAGDVTIVDSSVTGNSLSARDICGGLICNNGTTSVTNSTLADNTATSTGGDSSGAIDNSSENALTFAYVTFVGNQSAGQPAIDIVESFESFGSVLADSGPGGNCNAAVGVTTYGYNFADDTSCGFTGTGDTEGAGLDPLLTPLADNGGPGPTMLPQAASPLVDAIPGAACQTPPLATGITTDERSLPRPSALGPDCEIGAVELQPAPPPVIEPTFTG